jgi:hypothetical protein
MAGTRSRAIAETTASLIFCPSRHQQDLDAPSVKKRNAVINLPASETNEQRLAMKRGFREKVHKGSACVLAYGFTFGLYKPWKEECKGTAKRDLTAVQVSARRVHGRKP